MAKMMIDEGEDGDDGIWMNEEDQIGETCKKN